MLVAKVSGECRYYQELSVLRSCCAFSNIFQLKLTPQHAGTTQRQKMDNGAKNCPICVKRTEKSADLCAMDCNGSSQGGKKWEMVYFEGLAGACAEIGQPLVSILEKILATNTFCLFVVHVFEEVAGRI